MFSLKSPSNEPAPKNMLIMRNKCSSAMSYWSSFGTSFGYGHDLRILSDANKKSEAYSNLGRTYDVPPGQTNTFLAGSNNFKVSEIEVFQII